MKVGILVTVAVIAISGILLWTHDLGIGIFASSGSATSTMTASVATAPIIPKASTDPTAFDEKGTIVLDTTEGSSGIPYILYTSYSEEGKPSVRTKRLVFAGDSACIQLNLPCGSPQDRPPVVADEAVRVVGTARDDIVLVSTLERL